MSPASKTGLASKAFRGALALAVFASFGVARGAQKSRAGSKGQKTQPPAQTKPQNEPVSELARLRAQLVQATKDYKASLERLLPLYEAEVARAEDRASKTKELFAQGLVSKHELEKEETAAAEARAKVASLRESLKKADEQIAEVFVEEQAEEAAARNPPRSASRAVGGMITTTAYIRYGGTRAWSLSEAGAVEQFFAGRFGRQLPISSFGQSPVHDRWGFDHHNAMDVGVSPDSPEGRALMDYLRASGIPFTAFRYAIPGTATGPHIHVGRPSHRVAPK